MLEMMIQPYNSRNVHRDAICRRSAHIPAYDKNLDDEVRPTVVPGHVIEAQSENYWAPHPRTGVFGPATDQGGDQVILSSPAENGGTELVLEQKKGSESVLEQKAWFRPLEDVEMPRPHP